MQGGDRDRHSSGRPGATHERPEAVPDSAHAELAALRARCADLERENQDLRRAGEQLVRERDDYQSRYQSLPIASAALDATGTVLEANPALAGLLHVEPDAVAGTSLETAIAVPQHVQRFRDHLVAVFRSNGMHGCELWLRRPDGGVTRVRIESRALSELRPPRCRSVIFEVSLPATHVSPGPTRERASSLPPAHAPSASQAPLTRATRGTVLVVEDESLVRKAVQHYLTGAGYRVLTAIDAAGALERAEQHDGAIDLLLTDLSLPGEGTGPEIAQRIRQQRPETAVLYMTACPPQLLARRGFAVLTAETLEKPFSREALLARVARELARDRADGDGAGGRSGGDGS